MDEDLEDLPIARRADNQVDDLSGFGVDIKRGQENSPVLDGVDAVRNRVVLLGTLRPISLPRDYCTPIPPFCSTEFALVDAWRA